VAIINFVKVLSTITHTLLGKRTMNFIYSL